MVAEGPSTRFSNPEGGRRTGHLSTLPLLRELCSALLYFSHLEKDSSTEEEFRVEEPTYWTTHFYIPTQQNAEKFYCDHFDHFCPSHQISNGHHQDNQQKCFVWTAFPSDADKRWLQSRAWIQSQEVESCDKNIFIQPNKRCRPSRNLIVRNSITFWSSSCDTERSQTLSIIIKWCSRFVRHQRRSGEQIFLDLII